MPMKAEIVVSKSVGEVSMSSSCPERNEFRRLRHRGHRVLSNPVSGGADRVDNVNAGICSHSRGGALCADQNDGYIDLGHKV